MFACNNFSTRPDYDCDARLNIRISGFANSRDPAVFYTDVGLNDSGMIKMMAFVMTVSAESFVVRWDWPIPSRITLPPPNFTSSP